MKLPKYQICHIKAIVDLARLHVDEGGYWCPQIKDYNNTISLHARSKVNAIAQAILAGKIKLVEII